jgi:hypothetical protein
VTHRYTFLVGGTVISGREEPDVSAIAWAADMVIALGSDDEVRGTSRGDSHVVDLAGAIVIGIGDGGDASWPPEAILEVGGRADLAALGLCVRLRHKRAPASYPDRMTSHGHRPWTLRKRAAYCRRPHRSDRSRLSRSTSSWRSASCRRHSAISAA